MARERSGSADKGGGVHSAITLTTDGRFRVAKRVDPNIVELKVVEHAMWRSESHSIYCIT